MINGFHILVFLAAIITAAVIYDAVRRRLKINAEYRRRLAQFGRPIGPSKIVSRRTGDYYVAPPGFGFDIEGSEDFHPDWGGRKEVTSKASLYQRVRSARSAEIIRAADSMGYNDLAQAAIRLGHSREIAHAYAAEILVSEEAGEDLPAAMAHSPNVGGIGQPKYRGGNYVYDRELVDEMRRVQHFGVEPPVDPLMSLLATGKIPFTGFRNPIKALATGVKALGARIDEDSFDRLAEKRGDSRPEEIADGFLIRGIEDIQRLCELGNVIIATDPKTGLVVCHDPAEWQDSQIH
jgi:hypothetical protein